LVVDGLQQRQCCLRSSCCCCSCAVAVVDVNDDYFDKLRNMLLPCCLAFLFLSRFSFAISDGHLCSSMAS